MGIKKTWLECELIFSNGQYYESENFDSTAAFMRYCDILGSLPEHNVWVDSWTNKIFGLDLNWDNSSPRESVMSASPVNFLSEKKSNLNYVIDKHFNSNSDLYFSAFSRDTLCENKEIRYHHHPMFDKVKSSKILVVGGGPTSNIVEWQPDEYDHIFTCNHFFLNEKIKNCNIAYAALGDEVSLKDPDFLNFVKNSDTVFGFEDCNPARRSFREVEEFMKDHPGRSTMVHARYRSMEGATSRVVVLASLLGASEIHIVGMDGLKKEDKIGDVSTHAFQPGKRFTGTLDYDLYRRHFVMLWDYLLNVLAPSRGIKYINLGEGAHPSNQSTDITRQELLK